MPLIDHTNFQMINATDLDLAKFDISMEYIQRTTTWGEDVFLAMAYGTLLRVEISHDGTTNYNAFTKTITWDPNFALQSSNGIFSAAVKLGHEISHAADKNFLNESRDQQEAYALEREARGAVELGEPIRSNYNDVDKQIYVDNPTQHTQPGTFSEWVNFSQNGNFSYFSTPYNQNNSAPSFGDQINTSLNVPWNCTGYWSTVQDPHDLWNEDGSVKFELTYNYDPVVLNLAGASVNTVSFKESNVEFDMGLGQPMKTGWIDQQHGFLVEVQKSGTITSMTDLIGNLNSLKDYDSNQDGQLSATDVKWASLSVWVDASHKGSADSGEIHTLDEIGISSISLNIHEGYRSNNLNSIINQSTFTFSNGQSGEIASVELIGQPVNV